MNVQRLEEANAVWYNLDFSQEEPLGELSPKQRRYATLKVIDEFVAAYPTTKQIGKPAEKDQSEFLRMCLLVRGVVTETSAGELKAVELPDPSYLEAAIAAWYKRCQKVPLTKKEKTYLAEEYVRRFLSLRWAYRKPRDAGVAKELFFVIKKWEAMQGLPQQAEEAANAGVAFINRIVTLLKRDAERIARDERAGQRQSPIPDIRHP